MKVKAPPRPKPSQLDEVLRTLTIYDLLVDGLGQRHPPEPILVKSEEPLTPGDGRLILAESRPMTIIPGPIGDILIVAERIAARTEA